MGLYSQYILPKIIDFSCSARPVMRQRQKVVPQAQGRVLEIGLGSGLNLPFYDRSKVERVWGLEPAPAMRRLARRAAKAIAFEVELLDLPGEEIPLEDRSVDTVVVTYTLCTIPEAVPAILQMRRVLRPGGELLFCEHGASPDDNVRRWQDRVNPLWKRLGGGCHLNRQIPHLIEEGGFRIDNLETMYIPGWRPACFNYWGRALPR